MKTLFLSFVLFSFTTELISQNPIAALTTRPLNSININLLGDAALISINYDRLFLVNPTFAISGKLGMGVNVDLNLCFWADCDPPNTYAIIPHHVTGNFRIVKNHFVESGLGGSFIMKHPNQPYLLYPIIGYRYIPSKINMNFRIYANFPFKKNVDNNLLIAPVGFSLGVSF